MALAVAGGLAEAIDSSLASIFACIAPISSQHGPAKLADTDAASTTAHSPIYRRILMTLPLSKCCSHDKASSRVAPDLPDLSLPIANVVA
jgi:hypothetical protein